MNSQYELNLYKGASFAQMLTLYNPDGTVMDLTDGTVEAQIREYPEAYDAVDFGVSHNGSGGQIFLSLTSGQTSAISYSRGVYDVFLELNGTRTKVLMGEVNIVSDVTRYPWLGMGQYLRVLALPSRADFPLTGDIKTLYVSAEENALYRWAGDEYAILNCITIKGEKGDNGDKGDTGDRGAPGEDGLPGPAGKDGANGVGIESIEKTSTVGLVDTYTITLDNGSAYTFEVTNGQDASGDIYIMQIKPTISGGQFTKFDVFVYKNGEYNQDSLRYTIEYGANGQYSVSNSITNYDTQIGSFGTDPINFYLADLSSPPKILYAGNISGIPAGGTWGSITGTLANQTDLNTALAGKSDTSHTHGGIEVRPDYTISTTDLTAGTSALASGAVYFVYEV